MRIYKISPTMKLKEGDPSVEVGTIFIKLNRYTCFDVSNQSSGMHFCGGSHEKSKTRKKKRWWGKAASQEKEGGRMDKAIT